MNANKKSTPKKEPRYLAEVYYHGKPTQMFSGDHLQTLQVRLHLAVQAIAQGAEGYIKDTQQNYIIMSSCRYQQAN